MELVGVMRNKLLRLILALDATKPAVKFQRGLPLNHVGFCELSPRIGVPRVPPVAPLGRRQRLAVRAVAGSTVEGAAVVAAASLVLAATLIAAAVVAVAVGRVPGR